MEATREWQAPQNEELKDIGLNVRHRRGGRLMSKEIVSPLEARKIEDFRTPEMGEKARPRR
jgi:hypothetical protein